MCLRTIRHPPMGVEIQAQSIDQSIEHHTNNQDGIPYDDVISIHAAPISTIDTLEKNTHLQEMGWRLLLGRAIIDQPARLAALCFTESTQMNRQRLERGRDIHRHLFLSTQKLGLNKQEIMAKL